MISTPHVALLCLRGREESRASKDRRETRGRQGYQDERGSLEDQDLWCVSMDKLPSSCCARITNHQLVADAFRDPKENQCWVPRDHLGCQVHQAHQAWAKQDQLAHLDHRGLQDLLLDMVQVLFINIASKH